ncbi:MAG: hypothetical protein HYX47_20005 [Burkholderiales bacterium]|nr:hypothetical protein [Burkholderiales bacterium]
MTPTRSTDPLSRACTALWLATLSLMTAYMSTPAPAHRLLLARRIAANFATLAGAESFSEKSRASFSRLALRWQATARALAPPVRPQGGRGLLVTLLASS